MQEQSTASTGEASDGAPPNGAMLEDTLDVRVANLDCDADAARVRRALSDAAGVTALTVYPKAARLAIRFDRGKTSADALEGRLRDAGFPPQSTAESAGVPRPWKNPKVVTSALSGL
jgi:Cd2+/Zn2+-exporting ATPase